MVAARRVAHITQQARVSKVPHNSKKKGQYAYGKLRVCLFEYDFTQLTHFVPLMSSVARVSMSGRGCLT
jgi:hypothetical protein